MRNVSRRELLQGTAAAGFVGLSSATARASVQPFAFDPPIGACGGLSRGKALAKHGGAYLEVSCGQLLVPGKSEAAFQEQLKLLRASPVPVIAANSFLPGKLQCTGPAADHDAVLAYVAIAFERAQRAGIRTITFGSSGARTLPDGFPLDQARLQFVAVLARMAPLAEQHDIIVSVEPLQRAETNFLNRVSEALPLIEAVDHPHIRITADIFHMLREDDPPASIRKAGELIHHVHIAEKAGRTPPGTDGDNFRPYLNALREIGFEGSVSIECRWKDFDAEIGPALAALRAQISDV